MMKNKKTPAIRFKGFSDDWEQRELRELGEATGGTSIESEFTDEGKYKVISIGSYSEDSIYTDQNIRANLTDKTKNRVLNKDDLTMILNDKTASGNIIGRVLRIDKGDSYVYNQRTERIEPYHDKYNSHFLYNMLNAPMIRSKIVKQAQGNTQIYVNWSAINKLIYFIPTLNEQQKIRSFIGGFDNLITLHQRKVEKLKIIKKSMLKKMFPESEEKTPNIRFKGFNDDWEQRELGDYGYFYYGKSAPKWSVSKDAETPCIRYGELYTKHTEKIKNIYSHTKIPKENLKFSSGSEVLIPRVGENPLDFANCSWLSIPNVAIGEMISVYNTKQNPLFTAYMFNSMLKLEFAKRVEGGNVSNLYYSYLNNILISFPCREEQKKIATILEKISTLITLHQRKVEKLKIIKKSMLEKMFV